MKETLQTTLNGGLLPIPITKADLKAMAQNIRALEDAHQYAGGITANEIISMSRSADIKRAKAEIHQAVPLQIKGGRIHFVTNAGPDSDLTRHHVIVLLENYEKGMATGTPLQAAKRAAQGSIKFDCDCGKHTFWYRYITTILKVNAGRAELGFPKIRNPYLTGIACKHTLRVMEIIDELEPVKRGVYSGAVGYISWTGNLDTAIAIRTAVIKDGQLHIQAGAGIVYDSIPTSEWDETMNKARAVFRAVTMAEAGLEGEQL